MPGKKRIRLQTIGDCSHELSRLYNLMNRDQVDCAKGRALGYIINSLVSALRDSMIEERLAIIERKLKEFENNAETTRMRVAK